jgi:signal transduction histidine kinase/ActR/RegA family two-component response regulator
MRYAFLILVLLAPPFLQSCSPARQKPEESGPIYTSYQLIPKVTQQEVFAIETLKQKNPEGFTYGMCLSAECFSLKDGAISGYSKLFCDWLSALFDIPFTPVIYSWGKLLSGVEDMSIDFTGDIASTYERKTAGLYTTGTIAERTMKFIHIADNRTLDDIARGRLLNYGFLKGSVVGEYIYQYDRYRFEPVFIDDYDDVYGMLRSGAIDAFFDIRPSEALFNRYSDVLVEDFFPLTYHSEVLATKNPELFPIISIIQRYLETGAVHHLANLYAQGDAAYLKYRAFDLFTDEETRYIGELIESEEPIILAIEYDNYPISFYNEREKTWQGIAIDVLQAIGDMLNVRFIPLDERADRSKLVDMLLEGRVSLITELVKDNSQNDLFLSTDTPYQLDHYALISRSDYDDVTVNQILYARIGLIGNSVPSDMFQEWFPMHANTRVYKNNTEAFDALERREIDLLMGSNNILLSETNYFERSGFKANFVFSRYYESSFNFNRSDPLLCSIIRKSQQLVDTAAISDRWSRRVFDYRGKVARAQTPYLIFISLLLAFVLAMSLIMFIRSKTQGEILEGLVKQRTQELEIQTAVAKGASSTKSEFLARMSHEIRTPLNAIMGMTAIAKKSANSAKVLSSLNEITTASDHLLGIINDVLDMSKIESGKFVLVNEAFYLPDAMKEVADLIGPRCSEKKIRFASDLRQIPDISVRGDKLRLKQVLINLLGNAVKFTPENGAIDLILTLDAETPDSAAITFSVRDSGIGMSAEQLGKVFTPFEQGDSSIAVRFGGTGLGLAISQNLISQMNSSISVQSASGIGSTFMFTLLMQKAPLVRAEAPDSAGEALDLSGKRILLVEDAEINRLILIELLEDTRVAIDEAVDGQQALDMFSASDEGYYGLIFMDIQMPVMDGYEATRAIRNLSRPDAKTIPIIAMTANAYREDVENALKAGMNGHIAKPIDMGDVMRVLKTLTV